MLWVILWDLCRFSVTLPRPFHPVLGGILLCGHGTALHPLFYRSWKRPSQLAGSFAMGARSIVVLGGWSA